MSFAPLNACLKDRPTRNRLDDGTLRYWEAGADPLGFAIENSTMA
jgi:hypothetical protein